MAEHYYLCIDLKSFYASVECVERGLDPMTTDLVVADISRTESTVCLAVSPSLRAQGVRSRCRLFEIPRHLSYIIAPPQMRKYIDYAADIYGVYLRYIAPEDIYVYSIDEAFLDVTHYLKHYGKTAREMAVFLMDKVAEEIGVRATAGVGTNLYLAKIALDITAKHSPDFIGELDETSYRETLWDHQPLTDFWRLGSGIARKLEKYSILTMRDITLADEDLLYSLFGVDAELLIDHAWGREPVTIADIKKFQPKGHGFTHMQVLPRDYSHKEAALIVREMADSMCLSLVSKHLVTDSVNLVIAYGKDAAAGRTTDGPGVRGSTDGGQTIGGSSVNRRSGAVNTPEDSPSRYAMRRNRHGAESSHGTKHTDEKTNASVTLIPLVSELYEEIADPQYTVRRIILSGSTSEDTGTHQMNIFEYMTDDRSLEKDRKAQQAALAIKKQFGNNAILRGMDLQSGATARERNQQIGGHRSGADEG